MPGAPSLDQQLVKFGPFEFDLGQRTLRKTQEPPLVIDGPFAETKEQLLGFYIVDVADLKEGLREWVKNFFLDEMWPQLSPQSLDPAHPFPYISNLSLSVGVTVRDPSTGDVVAEIDDDIDVEVNEADLRVDVYRSSGKGGQHVNKTESAVRLTHIPTGIVVACQCERSQVKNRALAMKILRARIYEKTIDDKRAEMEKYYGEKGDIGWGNQIRSYVFQPYQMVKDLRTGVETGNIQAVMDGDIDAFINGWLRAGGPRTRNKDIKIED